MTRPKDRSLSVPRLAALGALTLLVAPAASRVQNGTFTKIVDTTTIAPGGSNATFSAFNLSAISGNNVTFEALYNSNNFSGIYSGTVGSTGAARVADNTTTPTGGGSAFRGFGSIAAVSGSNVAFQGTTASQGIYTGTVGSTGAARVVDGATVAPGSGGSAFTGFGSPAISGSSLVYQGSYSGGEGIYTGAVGSTGVARVADLTTTPTGGSSAFTGFTSPSISGNNLAFRGTYGSGSQGVYTGTVGGAGAVRVADATTVAPGSGGKTFTSFNGPVISGSNIAFQAGYSNGNVSTPGIYSTSLGSPTILTLADTNTAVPGHAGFNFTIFSAPAISGNNVAFTGFYNGFSSSGLFLSLNGVLTDVIDTGSPLFGSTVTSLGISSFDLDGSTLAFSYYLANGVNGIATVTGITAAPEPGTWAFLAVGAAGLGLVLRQRRAARLA